MELFFGALCDPIAVQLGLSSDVRFHPEWIQQAQKDANAITRLAVRGILSPLNAHHARKRLMRWIEKEYSKSPLTPRAEMIE